MVSKILCKLPWQRAKILFDGRVCFCCFDKGSIGNLCNNTFDEIWFGKTAQKIRGEMKNGLIPKCCNNEDCPNLYQPFQINSNDISDVVGYPIEIELDLHPTMCNYGGTQIIEDKTCVMCCRRTQRDIFKSSPDTVQMRVAKIKHIVPHLNGLTILGVAEPFWRDYIFNILDELNFLEYQNTITICTNTNGSVFTPERAVRFSEYVKKSYVNFSLDAATPETYKLIRRHDITPVLENVKYWSKLSTECNQQGAAHVVSIACNVNTLNVNEVPQIVQLTHDLGVKSLCLWNTSDDVQNPDIIVSKDNWHSFYHAEKKARDLAKKLNVSLEVIRPLDLGFSNQCKLF